MSKPSPGIARLQKEFKDLSNNPLSWAKVALVNDDLFKWNVVMDGPENTPYEKGTFSIDLELPQDYPFKVPKVKFVTKIYHPNVLQKDGSVCEQVFGNPWSPQSKLEEEVANQYATNVSAFNKTAKEWTKKYAAKK